MSAFGVAVLGFWTDSQPRPHAIVDLGLGRVRIHPSQQLPLHPQAEVVQVKRCSEPVGRVGTHELILPVHLVLRADRKKMSEVGRNIMTSGAPTAAR